MIKRSADHVLTIYLNRSRSAECARGEVPPVQSESSSCKLTAPDNSGQYPAEALSQATHRGNVTDNEDH